MTFSERHTWKGLATISGITAFFGLTDIINGASDLQNGETALMYKPDADELERAAVLQPGGRPSHQWKFRADGAALLVLGVLALIICLCGLRRRRR